MCSQNGKLSCIQTHIIAPRSVFRFLHSEPIATVSVRFCADEKLPQVVQDNVSFHWCIAFPLYWYHRRLRSQHRLCASNRFELFGLAQRLPGALELFLRSSVNLPVHSSKDDGLDNALCSRTPRIHAHLHTNRMYSTAAVTYATQHFVQ